MTKHTIDKIGVVYISYDGNISIKYDKKCDLFNNIGNFITMGKSTNLDVDCCYQTPDISYELIHAENKNGVVNTIASRIMNAEIKGNAVLIASSSDHISIEDLSILEKIYSQNELVQFVSIDTNNKYETHKCSKLDLNNFIKSVFNSKDSGIKKTITSHFNMYGYQLTIFSDSDDSNKLNNHGNLIINDFLKTYLNKKKPKKDKYEAEDSDNENENEKNKSQLNGKIIILNSFNKNYVDITIPEVKKLCYISTHNLEEEDYQRVHLYLKSLEESDKNDEYIVKNRFQYLNEIYYKLIT